MRSLSIRMPLFVARPESFGWQYRRTGDAYSPLAYGAGSAPQHAEPVRGIVRELGPQSSRVSSILVVA